MKRKEKIVAVHATKEYGATEVRLNSFYTSALAGGKRSASSHGRFTRHNINTQYTINKLAGPTRSQTERFTESEKSLVPLADGTPKRPSYFPGLHVKLLLKIKQLNLTNICSQYNIFRFLYFLVLTADTKIVPHFCISVSRKANPNSDAHNFTSAVSVCVSADDRSNVQ